MSNTEDHIKDQHLNNFDDGKNVNKEEKNALFKKMKLNETKETLDPCKPWIMRLDGHKFGKFTRPFDRPFDMRIHNAMAETCKALMETFRPSTIFTCSDEITLVFPALNKVDDPEPRVPIFSGRVQKITSLASGLASITFDRHITKLCQDNQKLLEHIGRLPPYFDARIHVVESDMDALENIVWRCHYDYKRNSVSTCAFAHFSKKQLFKVSTNQKLEKLRSIGHPWESLPNVFKYGLFIKKESHEVTMMVDKNNKLFKSLAHDENVEDGTITVTRTRTVQLSFELKDLNEENIHFIMSKTLPSTHTQYRLE